jgi:predicted nucleotidyltransferase
MLVEFQAIEPEGLVMAYVDLEGQLAAISWQSVDLVMAVAIRNPDVQRTNEASKRLIDQAVR